MWELLALAIYSVQWLGVVLGVGAEAVLLVGHLFALHARQPQWLANIPAVRTVQRWGLVLIVASGLAAVGYQLVNGPEVLLIPTFGFKWVLIALVLAAFVAERWTSRGRAWLEGFAGATWLALFVVHSVAPIFMWVDLFFFYAIWLILFYALWGLSVWAMRRGAPTVAPAQAAPPPVKPKVVAKPIVKIEPLPPPPPPPVPKPKPAMPAPAPVMARVSAPIPKPAPAPQPKPAVPVPKPPAPIVPVPPFLRLEPPHALPTAAKEPSYIPDYNNLPGVMVMPQKPEDLPNQNRAPIVQPA